MNGPTCARNAFMKQDPVCVPPPHTHAGAAYRPHNRPVAFNLFVM